MILQVNGKPLNIADNATADDLIKKLNYQDQHIALEVNEVIIAKSRHTKLILNEDDKVEIIKAVGGG